MTLYITYWIYLPLNSVQGLTCPYPRDHLVVSRRETFHSFTYFGILDLTFGTLWELLCLRRPVVTRTILNRRSSSSPARGTWSKSEHPSGDDLDESGVNGPTSFSYRPVGLRSTSTAQVSSICGLISSGYGCSLSVGRSGTRKRLWRR